jgi:hypothetical protein
MKDRIVIGTIPPRTVLSQDDVVRFLDQFGKTTVSRVAGDQAEANARLSILVAEAWQDWLLKDLERSTYFWSQFGRLFPQAVTPVPWTTRLRHRVREYCGRVRDAYLVLTGKANIGDNDY